MSDASSLTPVYLKYSVCIALRKKVAQFCKSQHRQQRQIVTELATVQHQAESL